MGLSPQNSYGIVNTKIIFPSNHTCTPLFSHDDGGGGTAAASQSSTNNAGMDHHNRMTPTSTTTTGHGGIETIYNPPPVAATANVSSLFNIHHDIMMDQGIGSGSGSGIGGGSGSSIGGRSIGDLPSNVIVYFCIDSEDLCLLLGQCEAGAILYHQGPALQTW